MCIRDRLGIGSGAGVIFGATGGVMEAALRSAYYLVTGRNPDPCLLYTSHLDGLQFTKALTSLWRLVSRANKYIDETAPWVLGKDESKKDRLACVIYNLCETLRIISVLLTPFMPQTAESIQKQIGVSGNEVTWDSLDKFGLHKGNGISKGDNLFPRLDTEKELEELQSLLEKSNKERKMTKDSEK